jgi:5-methylcytosine-specific restriction endonuclease McrA
MKRAGQKVYDSRKWRRVRKAYLESKHYICERCGQPATIVHHKKYLTDSNVENADIAYNIENLEALCLACHNLEHEHFQEIGAVFSSSGDVVNARPTKAAQEFLAARGVIQDKF